MNLKNKMLSERSQSPKTTYLRTAFRLDTLEQRKSSDREQIRGGQGSGHGAMFDSKGDTMEVLSDETVLCPDYGECHISFYPC